jgi:hypothetical protein
MERILFRMGKTKKAAWAAFSRCCRQKLLHAVLPAEFFDATAGVDDFLLPGIEGMAVGAHLDVYIFSLGRTRFESVPATAGHGNFRVIGMDIRFHDKFQPA